MKRSIVLATALSLTVALFGNAQQLKSTTLKTTWSKAAGKAKKKGMVTNAGMFWNSDKTELYKFSVFNDKKSGAEMVEVHTYNQQGAQSNTETFENKAENLTKYKTQTFNAASSEARQQIEGVEAAFIKNPVLAGKPDLVYGSFQPKYGSLGVFQRFRFQKSESKELNERFWAQVYYPRETNAIERNNYLIMPPPQSELSRLIFKARNSYMPKDGTAYMGGMMAISGSDVFLSGIIDLRTAEWLHRSEIKMPEAFFPGELNYARLENGSTGILFSSKEKFRLLLIDEEAKEDAQIPLSINKTGGQHGVQPSTFVKNEENDVLIFTTTSNGMSGGNIGLSVAKVSGTKELWAQNYANEDLELKSVQPLKEKVKVKKFKMPMIQDVLTTSDNEYMVLCQAVKNTSNGNEMVFMIAHLSNDGKLQAVYPMPAIKPAKESKLKEALTLRLLQVGESYYVIARAEVDGYQKGQYSDVSTWNAGGMQYTLTESMRLDETLNAGYVMKISTKNKTASSVVQVEDLIVGELPGSLSADGALFIQSFENVLVIK